MPGSGVTWQPLSSLDSGQAGIRCYTTTANTLKPFFLSTTRHSRCKECIIAQSPGIRYGCYRMDSRRIELGRFTPHEHRTILGQTSRALELSRPWIPSDVGVRTHHHHQARQAKLVVRFIPHLFASRSRFLGHIRCTENDDITMR